MSKGTVQLVIDTSALIAVLLEEPERPALVTATRGTVLLAPASLPWEVGNALVATVRRRRLTRAEAAAAWTAYEAVPLRLLEVDIGEAMATAIELGLYAYEAYFLVLARSRRLPLLTLDQRLGAAAARARIALVEF
jgi:predicted nucleic acid-binding protein